MMMGCGVTPPFFSSPAPAGSCFNFQSDWGRALPPGPPPLLPWTPSFPPPLALNHLKFRILETLFRLCTNNFSCAFGAPIPGFFGHSACTLGPLSHTYQVTKVHKCVLWLSNRTVPPRKTRRCYNRNPVFSVCRQMDLEGNATGIQCCTKSMFHNLSQKSNRKCLPV